MKTIERHRYRDKKIFQTRTLTFEPYPMTEIDSVIGSIVSNLTPEMVTKKYREENASNPMFGHCYHSPHKLCFISWTRMFLSRELRLIIMTVRTGGWLTKPQKRSMISPLINIIQLIKFHHTLTERKNRGMVGSKGHTKGH